ncbi:TPA: integrase [Salmonella enterica]|nr:integrase [Salmonella enterica]
MNAETKVKSFKSNREINALKNIDSFIEYCKDIHKKTFDFEWESNSWSINAIFKKHNKVLNEPLNNELIDFAKSYIIYQYTVVGRRHKATLAKMLKVLSIVEYVLLNMTGKANINAINLILLDECSSEIRKNYKECRNYALNKELERMINFLNNRAFLNCGVIKWVSSVKFPETRKVDEKSKNERRNKLPNQASLNAMAEIFSLSDNQLSDRDAYLSSIFALLMCAPSRISEILALPEDCEIEEKDRNGVNRYGLRFFSNKGYGGDIKWIPTVMVPVAKKAIERLRKISKNARDFCLWAESEHDSFFRHPECPDKGWDEPLTLVEVFQALGYHSIRTEGKARARLAELNLKPCTHSHTYTLNYLCHFVLSQLPECFPVYDKQKKIKYSEALCVINKHQLEEYNQTVIYKPYRSNTEFFCRLLKGTKSTPGILERHGYMDSNGKPLRIRTHQARHLLNTIAQRGNMSQLDIAKWSGRAIASQNHVYNHTTEEEMLEKSRALNISNYVNITPAFSVRDLAPSLPAEFSDLDILDHGAVHVTEFGYCVHDYVISPCEKFRDCLHCDEQVCVKGENDKLENLEQRLIQVEKLSTKAKLSIQEEELGADKWFNYQERTRERLKDLISILKDPDIPEGSKIRLTGLGFTHVQRVLEQKEGVLINNIIKVKNK